MILLGYVQKVNQSINLLFGELGRTSSVFVRCGRMCTSIWNCSMCISKVFGDPIVGPADSSKGLNANPITLGQLLGVDLGNTRRTTRLRVGRFHLSCTVVHR